MSLLFCGEGSSIHFFLFFPRYFFSHRIIAAIATPYILAIAFNVRLPLHDSNTAYSRSSLLHLTYALRFLQSFEGSLGLSFTHYESNVWLGYPNVLTVFNPFYPWV